MYVLVINNDNDNDMDDNEYHVIGRLFCSTSRATVAAYPPVGRRRRTPRRAAAVIAATNNNNNDGVKTKREMLTLTAAYDATSSMKNKRERMMK